MSGFRYTIELELFEYGEVDPATLEDVYYPPMLVATRDNIDSPDVKKALYVDACP